MPKSKRQLQSDRVTAQPRLESIRRQIETSDAVVAARKSETAKRQVEIDACRKTIADIDATLTEMKRKKTPRWPVDIPTEVLQRCQFYWNGTTEHAVFRVHCWNTRAVWTSYPAGGYSDNGGWHRTSPHYDLLSMTENGSHSGKPRVLMSWDVGKLGRFSKTEMQGLLTAHTHRFKVGNLDIPPEQWMRELFEHQNCDECGKGAEYHDACFVMWNWFVKCRPDPVVTGGAALGMSLVSPYPDVPPRQEPV